MDEAEIDIQDLIKIKEDEYTNYIEEHRDRVKFAWNNIVKKLPFNDDEELNDVDFYNQLEENIEHHDENKFDSDIFQAYRKYFYPINQEEYNESKEEFKKYANVHQKSSPHHWEYWLDDENKNFKENLNVKDVKMAYYEMFADWLSFNFVSPEDGQNKTLKFSDWWNKNKSKIKIYPELQDWFNNKIKDILNFIKEDETGTLKEIKESSLILNLANKGILTEARMNQLQYKTRSQTPKLADRADFVNTDYIGISKNGIFNFRTTSQSRPGKYWYQTIEIPNLSEKLLDEEITPDFIRTLMEQDDIKVYCNCEAFLYWSLKYMAHTRDYGIEPEDRAPQRNNVRLQGALCKHLLSVTDLIKSGSLYEQMSQDAYNWMRYQNGDTYKNFNKARLMGDAYKKKNSVDYETADSYMNDYIASQHDKNKWLDDEDIKGSLKAEIERTAKTDPSMTLDDFIREEFGVDGIKGLAQELQISEDYVERYFKNLGF